MEGSFAPEPPPNALPDLVRRLEPLGVDYLLRHQKPDGTFSTRYDPLQDQLYSGVDLPRLAHAAWVLARAAKSSGQPAGEAAARTTTFLLNTAGETADGIWLVHDGNEQSVAEISLTALALCEADGALAARWVPQLAAALWSRIDVHGCVHTHRDTALATDAFQDYFPGQVLLALGSAAQAQLTPVDEAQAVACLPLLSRSVFATGRISARCRGSRRPAAPGGGSPASIVSPSSLSRLPIGYCAFSSRKPAHFSTITSPIRPATRPRFISRASRRRPCWRATLGEAPRHRHYLDSCRRGLQFLDSLIIQPRDATVLPNPALALGGLRRSSRRSEVYVDFVQHYLAAVLESDQASHTG